MILPRTTTRRACLTLLAALAALTACNDRSDLSSTTTLTVSPGEAATGAPVTLTAAVVPTPPSTTNGQPAPADTPTAVPTGTVSFFDELGSLGTATLGAPAASSTASSSTAAQATLTVGTLPAGPHALYALYNGDATYLYSSSAAVRITITGP